MIKSAAQCLLFAVVYEAVCKGTVKKGVTLSTLCSTILSIRSMFFLDFEFRYAVLMYVDDLTSQMPKRA